MAGKKGMRANLKAMRPRVANVARKLAPAHSADRVAILLMQGSPEYHDFVSKVSSKTCTPRTGLFRLAFREWCMRYGHGVPPEL